MSTKSEELINCTKCVLHQWRTNVVPGVGPARCDIMLVGEAPGRDEDILGKPFVGAAGNVLKEAIEKAGYERKDVYITNTVKCRPPTNRRPTKSEIDACIDYLRIEIDRVFPDKIILLGRTASKTFNERFPMHDRFMDIRSVYHPAYALHAPGMREIVIDQIVRALKG